jgi:DNA mismatch repair protein MutS
MNYIALLLALAFQTAPLLQANDSTPEITEKKPLTLRDQIQEINEEAIPIKMRFWSSWTYNEFLNKCIVSQIEQLPHELQETSFKITSSTAHATTSIVREPTTWQDLAMFAGKQPGDRYVGKTLCKTKTEIGKAQLLGLLAASTDDHSQIKNRQTIIKTLIENQALHAQLMTLLENCAASENLLFTFWQQDHFLQTINQYEFKDFILKRFNGSAAAFSSKYALDSLNQGNRLISNTANLQALIACLLAIIVDSSSPETEKLLAQAKGHHQNFISRFLWEKGPLATKWLLTTTAAYLTFVALDNTIENQVDSWLFEEILHLKLTQVATTFDAMAQCMNLLASEETLLTLLPELNALQKLFATTSKDNAPLRAFLDLIKSDTFAKDSNGFFANRGKILQAYKELHTLKESFAPALQALSLLDAYACIASLLKAEPEKYCFIELEQADTPHLYLENFINPLVATNNPDSTEITPQSQVKPVVSNSIELGGNGPSRNCIITGPNAGGKSTLIKAIGINVLMAQSLGIAAAKRCVLTPFSFVATYLNITDDINAGNSLFKAEVLRTQELIKALDSLEPRQHGLLIFDEIFNGTTPKEGSAAAYAVAEHLGTRLNGMTILATHFEQLTKLEALAECSYKNYMVTVSINEDGSLNYPFKIQPGISQQHIALDILRSEGYTGTIITRTANLLRS